MVPHLRLRLGAAAGLALAFDDGNRRLRRLLAGRPWDDRRDRRLDRRAALPDARRDWSVARVTLVQAGSAVIGYLAVSRDGARYPLRGTLTRTAGHLVVEDLPGTSTCDGVQLILMHLDVDDGRVVRISGRAAGRCFGTVAGTFELQRAV